MIAMSHPYEFTILGNLTTILKIIRDEKYDQTKWKVEKNTFVIQTKKASIGKERHWLIEKT